MIGCRFVIGPGPAQQDISESGHLPASTQQALWWKESSLVSGCCYPLVCQSAQEIGGNKSQVVILVIYFQLRKNTYQIPLFSWRDLKFS